MSKIASEYNFVSATHRMPRVQIRYLGRFSFYTEISYTNKYRFVSVLHNPFLNNKDNMISI